MAARLLPLLVLAVSLAWPASCKPLPVLVPVTKDPATLLYTIPFHYGADLVVDTAGPLVWSTCQPGHLPAEFPCSSDTCRKANAFHVPGCRAPGCGRDARKDRTCTAYPYNSPLTYNHVTGACAAGDLVQTRFVANTTDGTHPVSQVNMRALAACAPSSLLKSLPRGASGVAGLAGSDLALPAQVASSQNVPNKLLLCLPRGGFSGDTGVAIFGGGPFQVSAQPGRDFTHELLYTPLLVAKKGMPPAHYVSLQSIAVESTRVRATGGAVVCTKVPFTLLRPDVYRPFVDAFARALAAQGAQGGPVARPAKPVPPFERCYDARSLANTRIGYLVPGVTLTLGGGTNWTMNGLSSMADIRPGTACLAFARMEGVKPGDRSAPAVLVGGFQMENTVLEFDMAKKRLGFVRLPFFTQCGHFNFTKTGY